MPNKHNLQQVELLKSKMADAKSIAIIDYQGTSAKEQVELRQSIRQSGGELYVSKNTLIAIAFDQKELKESLTGMNAVVFSYSDAVSALKATVSFHNDKKKLTIKQGLYEDKVLSPQEVENLSKLPSKEELIATLINRIQSPATGLVNVLKAGQRDLVSVLKNYIEKNQE